MLRVFKCSNKHTSIADANTPFRQFRRTLRSIDHIISVNAFSQILDFRARMLSYKHECCDLLVNTSCVNFSSLTTC